MIALLTTILGGIFSGGATGLLGILIQRFFDARGKAQDIEVIRIQNQQALALAQLDMQRATQVATIQANAQTEAALQARMSAEAAADAQVQAASYGTDQAAYLTPAVLASGSRLARVAMGLVDFTRGMTRPLLTAYLVIVAHLMYRDMTRLMAERGQALTAAEVQALVLQVIGTLLYLATTAVVWWFGTRPPKRGGDR